MREARTSTKRGLNGANHGPSGNGKDLVLQFARMGLKSWIVGSLNGSCNEAVKGRLTALFDQHRYLDAMAVRDDLKRRKETADSTCRRLVSF
jgi:hypothetical protein